MTMVRTKEVEMVQASVLKEFCCEEAEKCSNNWHRWRAQRGLFKWKSLEYLYALWDDPRWVGINDAKERGLNCECWLLEGRGAQLTTGGMT